MPLNIIKVDLSVCLVIAINRSSPNTLVNKTHKQWNQNKRKKKKQNNSFIHFDWNIIKIPNVSEQLLSRFMIKVCVYASRIVVLPQHNTKVLFSFFVEEVLGVFPRTSVEVRTEHWINAKANELLLFNCHYDYFVFSFELLLWTNFPHLTIKNTKYSVWLSIEKRKFLFSLIIDRHRTTE